MNPVPLRFSVAVRTVTTAIADAICISHLIDYPWLDNYYLLICVSTQVKNSCRGVERFPFNTSNVSLTSASVCWVNIPSISYVPITNRADCPTVYYFPLCFFLCHYHNVYYEYYFVVTNWYIWGCALQLFPCIISLHYMWSRDAL